VRDCGGKVHRSECDANGARVDVSDLGGCTPPAGTFSCGRFFCAQGSQYCAGTFTPLTPGQGIFQCLPLPSACGTNPTCACVPEHFGFT
jgi:hypothetical protein